MAVQLRDDFGQGDFGIEQHRGGMKDDNGATWAYWSRTTSTDDVLVYFPNIEHAIAIKREGEGIESTARRALDRAEGKSDEGRIGFLDMAATNLVETQPGGRALLASGDLSPFYQHFTDGAGQYIFFPYLSAAGACRFGESTEDAARRIWQAYLTGETRIAVVAPEPAPPPAPSEREILAALTPSRFMAWLLTQPMEESTGVSWGT